MRTWLRFRSGILTIFSTLQLNALAMFLQQLFSSTAASKGPGSEAKKQAAVGIGCIMMKVRLHSGGP